MIRSVLWIPMLILFTPLWAVGNVDSILSNLINDPLPDSSVFERLEHVISNNYMRSQPDSALILAKIMFQKSAELDLTKYQAEAKQLLGQAYNIKSSFTEALAAFQQAEQYFDQAGDEVGKHMVLKHISEVYYKRNDYSNSFEYVKRSLQYHELHHDTIEMAWDYLHIGRIYLGVGDFPRSLDYSNTALAFFKKMKNEQGIARSMNLLGINAFHMGKLSRAIDYYRQSLTLHLSLGNKQYASYNLNNLGRVYKELGKYDKALMLFYEALKIKTEIGDRWATSETLLRIGQTHQLLKNSNEAIEYCGRCLELTSLISEKQWRSETYQCLYQANRDLGRYPEAIGFIELYLTMVDSIARDNADRKLQKMELENNALKAQIEQDRRDAIAQQELHFQKLVRNGFIVGFSIMLLATLLFFRQRNKIKKAYRTLKSTQAQLIQSEKMASLGEMTAGIAHEIQNPLNFVNNFSEVNKELLEEMREALDRGDLDEAVSISRDLTENEDKIIHHGKRADGIVKSMLQHSRGSSGQKELTNINFLCDEYLRLAYHGLRARDKTFNADFNTDLDPDLPQLNIVPQDIGRVLLNLITNAFDACRSKQTALAQGGGQMDIGTYKPEVTISTKQLGDEVVIRVKDNGYGISQNVMDKLFQPFFTTKPTGQGTGLGLSISYDIVKAHNGDIHVDTEVGEGTEFIIMLPV